MTFARSHRRSGITTRVVLALLGSICLSGASLARADEPLQVTDDRGRTATFAAPPQRIAACSSFALEVLMALDAPPVVRFESRDLYPPEAAEIPIVGRSHSTGPDLEALAAHRPQVILLHEVFASFADPIERTLRVPVLLINVRSLEELPQKIGLIGQLTGKEAEARALLADLEETRAELRRRRPAETPAPRVLSLVGTDDAWYAHRSTHFMGSLLAEVGAENIASRQQVDAQFRQLAPIDLEQVLIADPEVIFLFAHGNQPEAVLKRFAEHPAYRSLRAVRTGRVHTLPNTIYTSQPGPRAGEALRELFRLIYPQSAAAEPPVAPAENRGTGVPPALLKTSHGFQVVMRGERS